jgi:hypothetical protein
MATVYEINKGINRSIEFKGIKAQYIMYLAVGLVLLLLLFAVLYVCGLKIYYTLGIVIPSGAGFVMMIQRLSRAYGETGLQKRIGAARLPKAIRSRSRQFFIQLKEQPHAKK